MFKRDNVSVCIATYNGEAFLLEQLYSIVKQLIPGDQLVIVDDCSSDRTYEMLLAFDEFQIDLFRNEKNIGHVKSFQKAISLASNDVVFLSDQDDIWVQGRVSFLYDLLLTSKCSLVVSNFTPFSSSNCLPTVLSNSNPSSSFLNSLSVYRHIFFGSTPLFGCSMCFNRNLIDVALPFPSFIEAHDLWLAQSSTIAKGLVTTNFLSVYRRIHSSNMSRTTRRPLTKVFVSRLMYILGFCILIYRCFR